MHQSIATIAAPEFINLQPLDINPLMSKCEVKVLYIGENRNHSYITKEVATEMAKTLRGAPIVGYYKKDKEDFADHGDRMIFDDEGIKFECLTKPYGFVSPDSDVWFQQFEEKDDFGNSITREYLMTTGYLWTEQFEECKSVIENGKGQSMELDSESLDGHWSTNSNTGIEFFIINDAIFSKLCILGDDVEPCFEGAKVSAPEVSTSFTKLDDNFKKTLYTMMQDLKFALEGGQKMDQEEKIIETEVTEEIVENNEIIEQPVVEEEIQESVEAGSSQEEFAKSEEDKKEEDSQEENEEEDSEDEKKKDYALIEEEYENLKIAYSELETKYQNLVEFKNQIDNEKKEELISSFYMLSDEDKAEVIENKEKYSLEDIEAKLSVICVRKKVNFDLENTSKNEEDKKEEISTYSLNEKDNGMSVPAWVSALKHTKESREV